MPETPQSIGAQMALKHYVEVRDALDAHGGSESPEAVKFIVAYVKKGQEIQETHNAPKAA